MDIRVVMRFSSHRHNHHHHLLLLHSLHLLLRSLLLLLLHILLLLLRMLLHRQQTLFQHTLHQYQQNKKIRGQKQYQYHKLQRRDWHSLSYRTKIRAKELCEPS